MALDYKDRYKERVATTFEYPFGKAINASSDTSDDGTPFEQDYINDQWGFFQKLLVDTGQTPNGVVDTANTSQYVDALKIMFREPLGENVFVAINRGFLAKITFYPVGGSGSIYKVFDANTNQPVDIYANKEGSVLIPQNDINNVASPEGDIIFFISEGDYYITINTQKIEFSVVSNLSSVSNQIVDIGDDVSTIRGDLNDTLNDILDLKNYNEREGAKVGSTLYSLYTKNEDVDQALFYTELKLLQQRKRDLDIGDSVAIVDNRLTTVADDQGALAQEVLQLTAATGVIGGQVTATVSRVNQAETDISGNAQAISALTTSVENTIGDLSDAQLILDSTVDELGVVSSRAYLGVSNTVGGKTTVTGITADSETNGLRFQGDVIQFDDTLGNPALQYRSDLNKWTFNGQLVVDGYTIDNENDVRDLTNTNLIRPESHWTVDTSGSQGIFIQNGSTDENRVELLVGPTDSPELVWNTFAGDNSGDGGWNVNATIDPTRSYRNSVWMKQVGGIANSLYLGCSQSNTANLVGTVNSNPYHWSGDLPQLDKWYLVVGIIHGSGYSGAASGISGVYDPVTGERVLAGTDFKNRTGPSQTQRVYRYYATQPTHTAQFARPRLEEINGEEPSLATLIGRIPLDGNDGQDGADGQTTYTWIKYADTATGTGISDNPTGKEYIGFAYNKTTPTESNTASDYTWSLIKGTDGVAGADGADGQTTYTWIAYSDFSDGTNLYQVPNDNTLYIGIAVNKTTATESNNKADYTWSKFKGDQGVAGAAGADGQVGAGFYGSTYTSISWVTSTTNSRFTTLVGRPPVNGDIFTQTRTDGTDSQARQYNGSSWVAVALQVNGSIVASGTIAGDKLIAGTEITAPRIVGGEIITNTGTGTRGEYYDDGTYLQWLGSGAKTDANGVFWIKKDGTGFIKGDFFQGEIIATVSATNSANASSLTATSGSYVSAGKPVSINFSQTLTVTVQGDTHAPQDFSCTILIKRGATTIKSVTVQPSRFNYPPSAGGQPGDLDTEAVYDISSFLVDNTTDTGSRTYTIESQSTSSPTSPYTYYNDHEVSLYAQENKLA